MNQSFISPEKGIKPLKMKAYGSIGHLPNSRMGPADRSVTPGMEAILTKKPRKGDRIIVEEKLDGSCMSVAKLEGQLIPLTRSGWRARDVTYEHLRSFEPYVQDRAKQFDALLNEGERVVGEWIPMAHGTIYDPNDKGFSPFIAFDIFRDGQRILRDEFTHRIAEVELMRSVRLHDSEQPLSVEQALAMLEPGRDDRNLSGKYSGPYGFHGAQEDVEGAVWRVEREGRVDFLAKYVRPDKIDGKYFSNISGKDEIWFIERTPTRSEQRHNKDG